MIEDFNHFFITDLKQVEELYIPKLEGTYEDFIFDSDNPFDSPSSPVIKKFRRPLINCLECWRIFSYGNDDYEKETFPCKAFKKGDKVTFRHKEIHKYISDSDFKNIIIEYIKKESSHYFDRLEETLSEINSDANQKKFIAKIIDKAENSIRNILDYELNKYNKLIVGVLIKEYIFFVEKIFKSNEQIFPDFLKIHQKKIEEFKILYEKHFGFINELDDYIYRDFQQIFLDYEVKLIPDFLTLNKIWKKPKNDLVRYYLFLDNQKIFKHHHKKSHLHILNFLANRYKVRFKKQTDPKRIAKLSPGELYNFLK
jgi:hypothetical protein